ncbi:transglycosylase [Lecanora helva]
MHLATRAAAASIAVFLASFTLAQVSTNCQPLTATCPNDEGLATSSYFIDFTKIKSQPSDWTLANYEYVNYGPNGAEFTFAKKGDAPTMHSNWKFFFGRIEYVAKAALGKGIISSLVLLSDDLDEIDWEFGGTWVNTMETNYFGKAVTNYNVAKWVSVSNPQTQFHTYTLDWSPSSIVWSIDGTVVRTLTPAEAGNEYPQTPMMVSLSLWDGGDPDGAKGTQDWAGGITPIPPPENYTMYIKSVKVQNANPAHQYQYTDHSGSWKSIKVINTTSSSSMSSSHSSTKTSSSSSMSNLNSLSSRSSSKSAGSILSSSHSSTQSSASHPSTQMTATGTHASSGQGSILSSGMSSRVNSAPTSNFGSSHISSPIVSASSRNSGTTGLGTSSGHTSSLHSVTQYSLTFPTPSATYIGASSSGVRSEQGSVGTGGVGTGIASSKGSDASTSSAKSIGITASTKTSSLSVAGSVHSGASFTSSIGNTASSKTSSFSIASNVHSSASFNNSFISTHISASIGLNATTLANSSISHISIVASSASSHHNSAATASVLVNSSTSHISNVVSSANPMHISEATTPALVTTTLPEYSTLKSTITTSTHDASGKLINIVIGPSGVAVAAFNHSFELSANTTSLHGGASTNGITSWLTNIWTAFNPKLYSPERDGPPDSLTNAKSNHAIGNSGQEAALDKVLKSTNGTHLIDAGSSSPGSHASPVSGKDAAIGILKLNSTIANVGMNSSFPQKIHEAVVTEIVMTTVTSCPVTSTIKPAFGSPVEHVTMATSTVLITSTSTICTQCMAPGASSLLANSVLSPSSASSMHDALYTNSVSGSLHTPISTGAEINSPSGPIVVSPVPPLASSSVSTGLSSLGQPQSSTGGLATQTSNSGTKVTSGGSIMSASKTPTISTAPGKVIDIAKSPGPILPSGSLGSTAIVGSITTTISTTNSNGSPTQLTLTVSYTLTTTIPNKQANAPIQEASGAPAPTPIVATVSTTDSKGSAGNMLVTVTPTLIAMAAPNGQPSAILQEAASVPAPTQIVINVPTTDSKGNPTTMEVTVTPTLTATMPIGQAGSGKAVGGQASAQQAADAPAPSPIISSMATTDSNGNPTTMQVTVTPTVTQTMPISNPSGTVSVTSQNIVASATSIIPTYVLSPTGVGSGNDSGNGSSAAVSNGTNTPLVSPIAQFAGRGARNYVTSTLVKLLGTAMVFVNL